MPTRRNEEPARAVTVSCGKELHLVPVSRLAMEDARATVRKEYEDRGEQLEPPTYTVPLSGGGDKEYRHDEKSIVEDPDVTDEDRAKWEAYLTTASRLEVDENEAVLAVLIEDGVEEEPTEEWLARMKRRRAKLPETAWDLKVFYVMREFLRTAVDVQLFTTSMMVLAEGMGVDEAALDSVSELFRREIRKHTGPIFEQFAASLGEGGQTGDLVAQPGLPGDEGGEGVEDAAQ